MKKFLEQLLFYTLVFCLPYTLPAQLEELPPRGITGFNLATDQDFFPPGSTDHNYTMGILFNWYGPSTNRCTFGLPWAQGGIDKLLFEKWLAEESLQVSGIHFGYAAFTPEAIGERMVISHDRPYSGALVYQSSRIYQLSTSIKDPKWALRTRLGIAVLGLGIGEAIQSGIHYLMADKDSLGTPTYPEGRRPVPQGWSNQLADGGGFSLLYQAEFLRNFCNHKWFQMNGKFGASLGYYTRANIGFEGRIGKLMRTPWFIQADGLASINKGFPNLSEVASKYEKLVQKKKNKGEDESPEPITEEELLRLIREQYYSYPVDPPFKSKASFWPKECEAYLHYDLNLNAWLDNGLVTGITTTAFNDRVGALHYWQDRGADKLQNGVRLNPFTAELFIGGMIRVNYFELGYGGAFRTTELVYSTGRRFRNMAWGQIRFGWRL